MRLTGQVFVTEEPRGPSPSAPSTTAKRGSGKNGKGASSSSSSSSSNDNNSAGGFVFVRQEGEPDGRIAIEGSVYCVHSQWRGNA